MDRFFLFCLDYLYGAIILCNEKVNDMNIIELEDICFAYLDIIALSHLSLNIVEGETIVLRGPNGCGKSTLLQVLNGLLFPQKGEYRFQGTAITKQSMAVQKFAKKYHQRIAYLFQNSDIQLFSNNVEEEIAFGVLQMGLDEKEVRQRVDDMVSLLGLEEMRKRAPYHLSGGEKKKVALASILVVNPQILIMDEPLSGLDPEMQSFIITFLKQMKSVGKTIIIATHNDMLEKELSDRVIYMEHGEIRSEKRNEI